MPSPPVVIHPLFAPFREFQYVGKWDLDLSYFLLFGLEAFGDNAAQSASKVCPPACNVRVNTLTSAKTCVL